MWVHGRLRLRYNLRDSGSPARCFCCRSLYLHLDLSISISIPLSISIPISVSISISMSICISPYYQSLCLSASICVFVCIYISYT